MPGSRRSAGESQASCVSGRCPTCGNADHVTLERVIIGFSATLPLSSMRRVLDDAGDEPTGNRKGMKSRPIRACGSGFPPRRLLSISPSTFSC
jgi:hypothetical protein